MTEAQTSAVESPDNEAAPATRSATFTLFVCILVDLIGFASYILDLIYLGIGEVADIPWAPVHAYILYELFGSRMLAALGFIEELAPFCDMVPTACLGWVLENVNSPDLDCLRNFTGIKCRITKAPEGDQVEKASGEEAPVVQEAAVEEKAAEAPPVEEKADPKQPIPGTVVGSV